MLVDEKIFPFNRDNIVNYQRKLIQSPFESLPKPTSRNDSKYSICQLNQKINYLVGDLPHNLRWIGNRRSSHIEAYMYCLLMLSIENNISLLMFKNIFYQMCRKYLDVKKQKLLIEFLCLLQFSMDKFLFLKKYPIIEDIILQVFRKLQNEKPYESYFQEQSIDSNNSQKDQKYIFSQDQSIILQNFLHGQNEVMGMNKLMEIYSKFSKKFNFIKWTKSSQSSFLFSKQGGKKIHILIEKQYFFVLQILQQSQINSSKNKLAKVDKMQVQRLLKASNVQSQKSEASLHEKLNMLTQVIQKNQRQYILANQGSTQKNKAHSSHNSKETRQPFFLHFPHTYQISNLPKKQFKFPTFVKKALNKNQEMEDQIRPKKETHHKKLQYIDLMQSSFQQQSGMHSSNNSDFVQKPSQFQNVKFFKPKHFAKQVQPVFQVKNRVKFSPQKIRKIQQQHMNRSRQQSQTQANQINSILIPTVQLQKKTKKSKQVKFYSPPQHKRQSPEKKQIKNKESFENKKINQISFKQKQKEQIKLIDKKYYQKKEQIQNKVKNAIQEKNSSKGQISLFANGKSFNNRISLQNRNDLDLFHRFHAEKTQNIANKVQKENKEQNSGKKQQTNNIQEGKTQETAKNTQSKQKTWNTFVNNSQFYLKKRIFDHVTSKLNEQSDLTSQHDSNQNSPKLKRNRSMEQKDRSHGSHGVHLNNSSKQSKQRDVINEEDHNENEDYKESLNIQGESLQNGGFEIKISYA